MFSNENSSIIVKKFLEFTIKTILVGDKLILWHFCKEDLLLTVINKANLSKLDNIH